MSKHEIIIKMGNRIELMVPLLNRIEKMLSQQTLLNKEVLNSKEAAIFMGLSVPYLYKLRRTSGLKANRPNNGRLYFKREDVYNWMLSTTLESVCEKATEEEKMTILNLERN